MHNTEALIIKIAQPTKRKQQWLEDTARAFGQAVQLGLDAAHELHTTSRTKIHKAVYYPAREQFGLASDYARMAVNAAVSLARSYYGARRSRHFKRVSFPTLNGSQGIGLGTNAYRVVQAESRVVLRVSTGERGNYIWLPLCVPIKFQGRLCLVKGDAKLFQRGSDWYVMLPVRVTPMSPGCSGEPVFIGIDLGIVRLATVSTPDGVTFFDGREARHKREHFADLRRRYQHHKRTDRVKAQKSKDSRYMRDQNHKISASIVNIALRYDNPVIVLERLDGIRNRIKGSKRFKRMMSSWSFRELIGFIEYKCARYDISVIFVDPRDTSKMCSRCGHVSRSNRPDQSHFRCTECGYQTNADRNASLNIAAKGPCAFWQEPPGTARTSVQTEPVGVRPDGVKECVPVTHSDSNLLFPVGTSLF